MERERALMYFQIYTCQMWAEEIRFWSKKFVELAILYSYTSDRRGALAAGFAR